MHVTNWRDGSMLTNVFIGILPELCCKLKF